MYLSFVILLLFGFVVIFVFAKWYNSPKQIGKRGESRVHKLLSQLSEEYHLLENIVLKTKQGTTQIDHIVVSKYGIFTIETKNYRGEIYGDDSRKEWTQKIVKKIRFRNKQKVYTYVTRNHFYNPVKQSLGHVYRIKEKLSDWGNLKIIPIVVFTNRANISNVASNNYVVKENKLLDTIINHKTPILTDADVAEIFRHLSQINARANVNNKTHIRNIKKAQKETKQKISASICPRCGGTLVKRTGKYGSFYGCSNYPNCKFTNTI